MIKIINIFKKHLDLSIQILLLMILVVIIVYLPKTKTDTNIEFSKELGASSDIYQPYKLEGFGAGLYTQPEYDGKDMPDNVLVESQNIDFDIKTSIAPRRGTAILGTQSTSTNPIISMHTSRSLEGREILIRTSTTTIEWWNPIDSSWDILDTGYTNSKSFSFADGNTSSETENYTYFANGFEGLRRFRVAYGSISTTTSATTTLNAVTGYDSADDIGFSTSGTVTINGLDYAYTGISGWNLTGMTAVPAQSANEGVISAVETSGFSSAPSSSVALVIKDQRLYAAYKNSVYCSQIDAFQNFSFSATRIAGEGEIVYYPDQGQYITGLAVRPDYVAVFKNNYIGSLEFKDFGANANDIPVVKTISIGNKIGATNNNAITTNGFTVIFANGNIGPTELTRQENKSYDETVGIAEAIRPSLQDFDFTNSAIISNDYHLLTSVKSGNSDFNDTIIYYNTLYKRLSTFAGINANAFTIYGGEIYYGDAITSNVYQLFYNQYDDNGNPFVTNWKTKWFNFGEASKWKELGWVYVEGFISQNTTIKFRINLDDGGSLSTKEIEILGDGDYVSEPTNINVFGNNPFGIVPFLDASGANQLLHFSGYIDVRDLTKYKFRNVQFEGETNGTGQNFRINKITPFVNILDENYGRMNQDYRINN